MFQILRQRRILFQAPVVHFLCIATSKIAIAPVAVAPTLVSLSVGWSQKLSHFLFFWCLWNGTFVDLGCLTIYFLKGTTNTFTSDRKHIYLYTYHPPAYFFQSVLFEVVLCQVYLSKVYFLKLCEFLSVASGITRRTDVSKEEKWHSWEEEMGQLWFSTSSPLDHNSRSSNVCCCYCFFIVIVIVGSSQALHSIRTGCSPNVHCHTPIPILIVVAGVLEKTSWRNSFNTNIYVVSFSQIYIVYISYTVCNNILHHSPLVDCQLVLKG